MKVTVKNNPVPGIDFRRAKGMPNAPETRYPQTLIKNFGAAPGVHNADMAGNYDSNGLNGPLNLDYVKHPYP